MLTRLSAFVSRALGRRQARITTDHEVAAHTPTPANGPLPSDMQDFLEYLSSFGIFSQPAEGREYVTYHWRRFIHTLDLIPEGNGRLLEIGAAPFCMTLLLRARRAYELAVINYGSGETIRLESAARGETYTIPCAGINVECDEFPYPGGYFDVVLCGEVIEHLTFCPSWMLYELHRILRPNGTLVLTTPNALRSMYRYDSAYSVFHGRDWADRFSGYGPYGRHNREFTPAELRLLLEECGFVVDSFDVCDLEPRQETERDREYEGAVERLFGVPAETQRRWRGEQMSVRAHPGRPRVLAFPDVLYKSTHAIRQAQKIFPRIP